LRWAARLLISLLRKHAFVSRERGGSEECGNDERPPRHFCVDLIGARAVQAVLLDETRPYLAGIIG